MSIRMYFAAASSIFYVVTSGMSVGAMAVSGGPGDLFPKKRTKAEFVSAVFDEKAVDIGKRWTAAWDKEEAFLSKYAERYVANRQGGAQGESLPWHEKMGISQNEYSYMMDKFRHPKLQKMADASVTAEQKGVFLYLSAAMAGMEQVPGIDTPAIKFNTKTGELIIGAVNYGRAVYNPGRTHLDLVGRFVPGFEWNLEKDNAGKSRSPVGFVHLGRIPQEQGKCLLNLSVFQGVTIPIMGSYRYSC